jgi:hypothetical protein
MVTFLHYYTRQIQLTNTTQPLTLTTTTTTIGRRREGGGAFPHVVLDLAHYSVPLSRRCGRDQMVLDA